MTTAPPSGMLTDLYELTMARAYLAEGMGETPATFSLFVRELPPTRGYLVAAGLDDALGSLERMRYTAEDLAFLDGLALFDERTLDRLGRLRFTGSVRAVAEGTIVFGNEPIIEVTAPIVEAQIAETILLNQITTATTLASKAARYRHAARGKSLVDFAFRRAQGVDAAMHLVRAAAICGLAGTSNVAGSQRYDLPLSGTMAHSFVQAHTDERAAFTAFAELFGDRTILLVDTYDIEQGIDNAIEVARRAPVRAVRLDSGDFDQVSRMARRRLDDAGLGDVQIVASGGLDEHTIEHLVERGAPIDGFGVGSDLGVSADAPVIDTVYKLVDFGGRPVRKLSPGKETWPAAKQVWRLPGAAGDVLALAGEPAVSDGAEALLAEVMRDGVRAAAGKATLADANARFETQWGSLPETCRRLRDPEPRPVTPSPALVRLTESMGGDPR